MPGRPAPWCETLPVRPGRFLALLATAGLLSSGCGGSSDGEEPVAQDTTAELSPSTVDDDSSTSEPAADTPTTESPADDAAADELAESLPEPEPTNDPGEGSTDPGDQPATSSPDPTTATSEPAVPVDGCSTDGSPTVLEVAEGPRPDLPVAAGSEDSPFPELAVRRLNCAGGWAQLSNEIPADTPVLAWFWAPH